MILIDVTFASDNLRKGEFSSGVAVFLFEILTGIVNLGKANDYTLLITEDESDVIHSRFPSFDSVIVKSKIVKFPFGKISLIQNILFKKKVIKTLNPNAVWFPFAFPGFHFSSHTVIISTVHDIIPVHENPNNLLWKHMFKKICKNSTHVICDSEYVRNDIIHTLDIDPRHVTSVHNAITVDLTNMQCINELLNKEFILDINAYAERKNPLTLIQAFNMIKDKTNCDLVFCGGYNINNTLEKAKELASELNLEDRVHFFLSIPFAQRNWLLKNAKLMISPSLSEGFGRTPIEAAISGIPVLTTKSDSLYEVTLGLLNYIDDPMSVEECASKLLYVENTKTNPDELAHISDIFKKEYSQDSVAERYINIINETIKK